MDVIQVIVLTLFIIIISVKCAKIMVEPFHKEIIDETIRKEKGLAPKGSIESFDLENGSIEEKDSE